MKFLSRLGFVVFILLYYTGMLFPVKVQGNILGQDVEYAQGVLADRISELEGISAIGYFPLWRIEFKKDGIDIGMSTIQSGKFQYDNIVKTNVGWVIGAQRNDTKLYINIENKLSVCSMSKQWYPYKSILTVKISGKPDKVYNGTAIRKNQTPLAPHPVSTNLQLHETQRKDAYHFMDKVKFCLMNNDFNTLCEYVSFPVRVNSSSANIIIKDANSFKQKANELFNPKNKQMVLNCKYDEFFNKGDLIGISGGTLLLKAENGKISIVTINKN